MAATLAVVVPVFNGFGQLTRCLESLERHTPAANRILLVDDASTDARVAPLLESFAARRGECAVLTNPGNLGFVGAVNRALAQAAGDVVILNSDTQVTAGWLEALLLPRERRKIGIACPPPIAPRSSASPACPSLRAPAAAGRRCHRRLRGALRARLSTPADCGHLHAVTRELLDRVGTLDAVYGRGYGENDLSMRAIDGLRDRLLRRCLCAPRGEASFGEVSGDAERNGAAERRWPMYSPGVKRRCAPTPARDDRARQRRGRARAPRRAPRVLQVMHRFEARGGIEEHTRAIMNELTTVSFTATFP
jgi:hypothetical protein